MLDERDLINRRSIKPRLYMRKSLEQASTASENDIGAIVPNVTYHKYVGGDDIASS